MTVKRGTRQIYRKAIRRISILSAALRNVLKRSNLVRAIQTPHSIFAQRNTRRLAFGRTFRSSRSSGLRGTYFNILMVHAPCIKETKERLYWLLYAVSEYKVQNEGREVDVRDGGDDEALIEFESARIIVKRLKRPETNLFASESFLVEDNK